MNFYGSQKQQTWAKQILDNASLTDIQIDSLLRYAGPTMYARGIMDAVIIIENRHNLAEYADSLKKFFNLSVTEKKRTAENICRMVISV